MRQAAVFQLRIEMDAADAGASSIHYRTTN